MQCRQCNVELNDQNTYKSLCYVSKLSGKTTADNLCTSCRKHNRLVVYYLRKHSKPPTTTGCKICGKVTKLVCDHDHKTDQFRGWICGKCNRGLGYFNDDPNLISKALDYLNDRSGDSTDLGGE